MLDLGSGWVQAARGYVGFKQWASTSCCYVMLALRSGQVKVPGCHAEFFAGGPSCWTQCSTRWMPCWIYAVGGRGCKLLDSVRDLWSGWVQAAAADNAGLT
jgi:hypothetical protein